MVYPCCPIQNQYQGNINQTHFDIDKSAASKLTENLRFQRSLRGLASAIRFYPWALINKLNYSVHSESGASPLVPGLEVFKALEIANSKGKPIHYMGGIINESTLQALALEGRMYLISQIYRLMKIKHAYHSSEINDLFNMMKIKGVDQISEHLDDKHMGILMYDFEKMNPYQKPILIDQENERIFKQIFEKMEGKKITARNLKAIHPLQL